MRIALVQTNPIIGDIAHNCRLIRTAIQTAQQERVDLIVLPELAVIGYPPKDLLLKPGIVQECVEAVQELALLCTDVAALIGYPAPVQETEGRWLYNAAAFCHGGKIVSRAMKSLLPTYDVFDEHRYFEPAPQGAKGNITQLKGVNIGVSICEDLWNDEELLPRKLYHFDPIRHLAEAGARILVNCSASPFVLGKHDFRMRLFSAAARRHKLPLLYCNQVGGNDELVFDGNSCAFDSHGKLIAQAKDFQEDLLIVDLDEREYSQPSMISLPPVQTENNSRNIANRIEIPKTGLESIYHTLVLGLRDYCRKCGFKSIVLGLSGGIDSALTAALAVAAIGKENVRGVAMPSRFSSDHSINDARDVAHRLGIQFHVVPIEPAHLAFEKMLAPFLLEPTPGADTTAENVQARIRGVILMGLSNKFGSLLVTTGNKSELAVGYCTLYGDMAGGLAVISDVPKTMVWDLSRWINQSPTSPLRKQFAGATIPENSISKVPSAELRPNQTDQDSLPPYEVLDTIIERYVEAEQSARQIVAQTNIDPQVVLRMVRLIDCNEYKRKQAAPGIKVTGRAFGFGRRMPIAQRYDASRTLGNSAVKK